MWVRDRPDQIRRQLEHRVGAERRRQPLARQLDAITVRARKANLQVIPIRTNSPDLYRLLRRRRRRDHGFGCEVERHAEDVGVLGVEEPFLVEVVGLAAERAADHLLAQQLRAEGADAEDVRHVVRVPALGEH
jgi:hypothetical protein